MALPYFVEAFLEFGFLRTALLAGLLVALLGGALGVFLVLRNMSLLGDGLAHLSFAGIALGLVAGLFEVATAFAVSIGGAVLIHLLREHGFLKGDTAIGMIFTTGLASGVLLVSLSSSLVNVQRYLFGSMVAIGPDELVPTAVVVLALLGVLALFYREFVYMTFSEEAARVSGLPVSFLNLVFITLTAAAIVMASRITGVLLVSALVIIPAATALQLRLGFRGTLAASVGFAILSVLVGLATSVEFDLAPGATIALTNVAFFAVVAAVSRTVRRRPSGAPAP